MTHTDPEARKPRPDYPPKTPPPPKRPPNPPPPQTELDTGRTLGPGSGRAGRTLMRNRRGATWPLEAQPWSAGRASAQVSDRLKDWGCARPDALDGLVRHLVGAAVADGGRRVSVHLAEENGHALIMALSHQSSDALDDAVLPQLRDLGAGSCGSEMTVDGRQVWVLLDLAS
ncbi:hypothetical protein ACFWPV_09935 [Streptomyces uncialis]|uniref:hypothetical protein n=1 Tax=Streptomyces uncialis TaxID=1048205 RepID=UPI00365A5189